MRTFEGFALSSNPRTAQSECVAIGPDAEERHHLRTVTPHLRGQPLSPFHEFVGLQLSRRGGTAVHHIGDSIAGLQELGLLRRMKLERREPGLMQRRPEAVAGAREMVARGGGVQAGVDADEQDLQAGRDDVPEAPAGGASEVC